MMQRDNLDQENQFRCKNCPSKSTFKIESIAILQWEEHHQNFSKSILNPKSQYQALFILKLPLPGNVNKICLPDDWLLREEDLLDIKINNYNCPFFQCPYNNHEKRLIIDLPNHISEEYDSYYLIVNSQDIWNSKALVLIESLKRINEEKFGILNIEDIDPFNIYRAFTKRSIFKSTKYVFHYLIFTDPFIETELIDYWIKIPNICKLEESIIDVSLAAF